MTLQRILVGVDGSAASVDAVRGAMELVAPDGTIQLARVAPTSVGRRVVDWLLHGGLTRATQDHRETKAEWSLAAMAAQVRPKTSAQVKVAVSRGRIADELLRLSAEGGCELIVIGDARPRPLHRRLHGGVARDVARDNPRPTLIVPAGTSLSRVRSALVLAPEPALAEGLSEAGAALAHFRPRYDFMALGLGSYRSLARDLRSVPAHTVLIVSQRAAVRELGTSWILNHTSCPVLLVPTPQTPTREQDTFSSYAAWHGDVPPGFVTAERGITR